MPPSFLPGHDGFAHKSGGGFFSALLPASPVWGEARLVGLNSLAASWVLAALIYEAKRCRLHRQRPGGFCLSHLTPQHPELEVTGRRCQLPVPALGRAHKLPLCRQLAVLELVRDLSGAFVAALRWVVWLILGPERGRPGHLGICQVTRS